MPWPKSVISLEREGLQMSNLVYGWSAHHQHAWWPPSWPFNSSLAGSVGIFWLVFYNFCKCRLIFIIHSLLNWEMGCKRSWDKNVTPQNCCGINLQKITVQLYNFTFISARIICFTWHLFQSFYLLIYMTSLQYFYFCISHAFQLWR